MDGREQGPAGPAAAESAPQGVVRRYLRDAIIDAEGEVSTTIRTLSQGWAARCRVLANGERQIFRFLVPGDICGATRRGQAHMTTTIALTPVRLVERGAAPGAPELAAEVEAALAAEHAALLNHLVRLGRLTGYERLAHLLLELHERLDGARQPRGAWLPLPVTQAMLGEALGLSTIHVNRSLRQLRLDGEVAFRTGRFAVLEPERLAGKCAYVLERSRAPS